MTRMTRTPASLRAPAGVRPAIAVAVAALALSSCGSSGRGPAPATTVTVAAPTATVRLGFLGGISGAAQPVGTDVENGVKLAISQFDAVNPPVRAALDAFDTAGDPARARAGAIRLAADRVAALIASGDASEILAAGPVLEQAGVPSISVTATVTALTARGWRYFHRVVADDALQAHAAAGYLIGTLHATTVAVTGDSTAYGHDLATAVAAAVGSGGATVVSSDTLTPRQIDTVSARILAESPDAVFFAGGAELAGRLIVGLRAKGYSGKFMAGISGRDASFAGAAGPSASGAYLVCGCSGTADNPDAQAFNAAYLAEFGSNPGPFAAEAYDATEAVLEAISSGRTSPAAIDAFLSTSSYSGITRTIKFQADGNWAGDSTFISKMEDGSLVQVATSS